MLKGDAEGFCDSFDIEVLLDSDESEEVISHLVRLARQMCFTEKALTGQVNVMVKQTYNGKTKPV